MPTPSSSSVQAGEPLGGADPELSGERAPRLPPVAHVVLVAVVPGVAAAGRGQGLRRGAKGAQGRAQGGVQGHGKKEEEEGLFQEHQIFPAVNRWSI